MHRPRQGGVVQGTRRNAEMAEQVDPAVRGRRSGELERSDEGPQAPGGSGSRRRRGRRKPRVLYIQVLPAAALPARRPDGLAQAGVQAAVGEGGLSRRRAEGAAPKGGPERHISLSENGHFNLRFERDLLCPWTCLSSWTKSTARQKIKSTPRKRGSTCWRGAGGCRSRDPSMAAAAAGPERRISRT